MILLPVAGCGTADADEQLPLPLKSEPGKLTTSTRCGECHKDIYGVWKTSIHATSASNPVFLEAYDEAVKQAGDSARQLCLRCHAPASSVTSTLVLTDSLNQEGVSCDYCHSLTAYQPGSEGNAFLTDVGPTKFGPVKEASSNGHQVSYSEFHSSSELCAGCHEYTSRSGVPLLTTFSEWTDYSKKEGSKTCQECHMPLVVASVADPRVARVRTSFVNLHSMPGGHSVSQLVKAVRLRIEEVRRDGEKVDVRVSVTNAGAGHAVPTGSPARKVVLEISAISQGGVSASKEYVFQKTALDAAGHPLSEDSKLFLEGASIESDNRLTPGEKRSVDASFLLPRTENVEVRATLTYLYSPHDRRETEIRREFLREERQLTTNWSR